MKKITFYWTGEGTHQFWSDEYVYAGQAVVSSEEELNEAFQATLDSSDGYFNGLIYEEETID